MKVLLTGGGTGGSVSPVLAVVSEIRKLKPQTEFLFVGTKRGPERAMVFEFGISFAAIPAAKFRRYFSLRNFFDLFVLLAALIKAWFMLRKFRPDVIFSVGASVSVPVAWVGRWLGSKIIVHQQDIRIGLANKLIAPFASKITTAFEQTSKDFYSDSGFSKKWAEPAQWVGNPFREELLKVDPVKLTSFGLTKELPILLVLGGATGAMQINQLLAKILPELVRVYQVVHVSGKHKNIAFKDKNYHQFEFLPFPDYAAILNAAHVVVARAGMSTVTELSVLNKVAVIIPMPGTHQEDNAKILKVRGAAVVLSGKEVTAQNLATILNSLKFEPEIQKLLSLNIGNLMPKNAALKLAKIILDYDR